MAGATQVKVAWPPGKAVAMNADGLNGRRATSRDAEGCEATEVPVGPEAVAMKVYDMPFVSPVI